MHADMCFVGKPRVVVCTRGTLGGIGYGSLYTGLETERLPQVAFISFVYSDEKTMMLDLFYLTQPCLREKQRQVPCFPSLCKPYC